MIILTVLLWIIGSLAIFVWIVLPVLLVIMQFFYDRKEGTLYKWYLDPEQWPIDEE